MNSTTAEEDFVLGNLLGAFLSGLILAAISWGVIMMAHPRNVPLLAVFTAGAWALVLSLIPYARTSRYEGVSQSMAFAAWVAFACGPGAMPYAVAAPAVACGVGLMLRFILYPSSP